MVERWIITAVLAALCWGAWGFLAKLASKGLCWEALTFMSWVGVAFVMIPFALFEKPNVSLGMPLYLALISGAASGVATIFFYLALSRGEASIVVPLTAMYPAVTVVLSLLFLNEKLTLTQTIGVGLAVLAAILLSM